MTDAVVLLIALALIVGGVIARRMELQRRRSAACTVAIDADTEGVVRRLVDGRVESARWAKLSSVEVVCTPIKTADGASSFMLLAEAEEVGCLVPLGVDLDGPTLTRLASLPGFRLETLHAAAQRKAPCRTVIWTRE